MTRDESNGTCFHFPKIKKDYRYNHIGNSKKLDLKNRTKQVVWDNMVNNNNAHVRWIMI